MAVILPANERPALDAGASIWLDNIEKATLQNKTCPVPQKYFDVLKAWGFVTGEPEAAKLTGEGMSEVIAEKEVKKARKAAKKPSRRRK